MRPPILSDEKIDKRCNDFVGRKCLSAYETGLRDGAYDQLDADVAYYEHLIEQARAAVAREIDMLLCVLIRNIARENIDTSTLLVKQLTPIMESLKSKYGGKK